MQEMNRENIHPINIEDEMQASYIDYSMSVIGIKGMSITLTKILVI